ncbi:MAG: murein biosynthesis integral membrane protein MurJ [Chthoniobacterales bacterium]
MSKHKLNTRAAGLVAVAVMLSRVLGLVRDSVFAYLFGAGRLMDVFNMAFRLPNLLRDLFAEGALSTAFITVFSKKIESDGDDSAWALASKITTLALVFMSAITLLGIVMASSLVSIMAPGFDAEKAQLTVHLTQIMFPFILLVSLAALTMGMLNARNVFGIPALASSFFNLGSIVGGVFFGWLYDPSFGPKALTGLAIGTLIGGFLQLIVQLPSLRRVGFRFNPDFRWRDSGVKQVLILMIPSVIAGSAVQINVVVNSGFASCLQEGAVTWLQNAFRLMQLPLGIFGVAIATVTLPVVSKIAVTGDKVHFRETLAKAMRLATFLTIPSAMGLLFLSEPIISLIYERGKFTHDSSVHTAQALQFYAIGLIGYSCIKVLSPAFYAINKKWTPMFVSFGSIGINIILSWILIFKLNMGHRGLALSTAISATLNFGTLYLFMRSEMGSLVSGKFVMTFLRCITASLLMAAWCWAVIHYGHYWVGNHSFLIRALTLFITIGVATVLYFGSCWVLRVEEVHDAIQIFRRKLVRR